MEYLQHSSVKNQISAVKSEQVFLSQHQQTCEGSEARSRSQSEAGSAALEEVPEEHQPVRQELLPAQRTLGLRTGADVSAGLRTGHEHL